MPNIKLSLKSCFHESDLDDCERKLSVTGENAWYFKGSRIVENSGKVPEDKKDGDRIIVKKNFFSTEYTFVRANGDEIPESQVCHYIYVTEGGSYIGYKTSSPGISEAKIFETIKDIKSFFGNKHLAQDLYQKLVKSNPQLASDLLSDHMNVIK